MTHLAKGQHTHSNRSFFPPTVKFHSAGHTVPPLAKTLRKTEQQHNTTQHNTTQHNTTQHNTTQHKTRQDKTRQDNTTQHNTTQHNTTQTQHHNNNNNNYNKHSVYQRVYRVCYNAQTHPVIQRNISP